MGLLDIFKTKVVPKQITILPGATTSEAQEMEITNAYQDVMKKLNDIDKGIDEITGPDYRIFTIQDWLNAMRAADQPWSKSYRPNWVTLFDIFQNMIQDPHIAGVIETLQETVKSKDFYITDSNNNRLDDVTEMFKSKWFYDFITTVINSKLYGFSLCQLQDYRSEDMSITSREINRRHVRPDLGGVVKQQYDNDIMNSWEKEPFKSWTIFTYNSNLGRLNTCVRWWIYKTEVSRLWAKYNQLFGIPPIVAKTSLKDTKRKQNAIDMLKNWLKTRWMVIDDNDTIEAFNQTASGSTQQLYENFIRLCDQQISKALLGSTMVMDEGSSRAQSETHADNTKHFTDSLCRLVKFITTKELFKRLRKIGFQIPEDAVFNWDYSEKLTMLERAQVVSTLSNKFKIHPGVAGEFVGIELEEREEQQNNPFAVDQAIQDYKKRLNEQH